jgi:hypothetical protein
MDDWGELAKARPEYAMRSHVEIARNLLMSAKVDLIRRRLVTTH